MEIAFIDHYDSFSFNLIDWIKGGSLPIRVRYVPFDVKSEMERLLHRPIPLILSPGPKSPAAAESSKNLVSQILGKVPVLGVCLGHQIIGEVLGFETVPSRNPLHGGVKQIRVRNKKGIFHDHPDQLEVASYHSLALKKNDSVQQNVRISAVCEHEEVMAIEQHYDSLANVIGVQFHPESFLGSDSSNLRLNWLNLLQRWSLLPASEDS